MKKTYLILGVILGVVALAGAKPPAKIQLLGPGNYSAKVKALVCEGCGPLVQEGLSQQPGLEKISVDQNSSMAYFSVKKGAQVSVAQLQKALQAKASEMGMGADYTLYDIKSKTK